MKTKIITKNNHMHTVVFMNMIFKNSNKNIYIIFDSNYIFTFNKKYGIYFFIAFHAKYLKKKKKKKWSLKLILQSQLIIIAAYATCAP